MRLSLVRTCVLIFMSVLIMAGSCGEQKPPVTDTTLTNPGNFKAEAASETTVNLSWSAVSTATGYSLERKIEGGSYTILKDLAKTATS